MLLIFLNRKYDAENCIKTAAKIISPAIEAQFSVGYDWYVHTLTNSSFSSSIYSVFLVRVASLVEIFCNTVRVSTSWEGKKLDR